MQLIFYYNPNNKSQNQGVNFSPEFDFYVEYTEDEIYEGSYTLVANQNWDAKEDIYSDGIITSLSAIVGKNGSGKTYLLRSLLGTESYDNGDFADRPSTLYIIGTKKSHFVQGIIVDFDRVYNKWQTIKNDYKTIIEQYIVKYGNPYSVDESFDYPYEEGDGYEMLALKLNKCNYRTTFKLTKGNIVISLREDATIAILYSDTENATLGDYENNSKIQSDI